MVDIDDMRLFRALGTTGSLAAAARLLDVTPPALTARLKKLEERLGVHLAVRGARGITLTEAGQRLLDEALELLERIDSVAERIGSDARAMAGALRVVAPFGFGRQYLAPLLRDFHRAHPQLRISLHLSDNPLADAAGADMVVHIGAVKDSSWVGHPLAPNARLLCASPGFVRGMAPLEHPSQLAQHACLCLRENHEDLTRWRFSAVAAPHSAVTVRVNGALASNDGAVIGQWATAGLGIMVRSEWDAAPLIARGELVALLPDWRLDDAPVLALLPSRKGTPLRLRKLVEAAKAAFQPVPWRGAKGKG
jgi:DNA-binding transcriptional LysR family regulator